MLDSPFIQTRSDGSCFISLVPFSVLQAVPTAASLPLVLLALGLLAAVRARPRRATPGG